jgi:hypothetical protein
MICVSEQTHPDRHSVELSFGNQDNVLLITEYIHPELDKIAMKKIIDGFINNPLASSIFAVDFLLLIFIRPPFFFSMIMLGTLAVSSMYLGQKMAPFK